MFSLSDFSLAGWAADTGVTIGNMTDLEVHKFYDAADIGWFLQFPSCDRNDAPFSPSINGWNNSKFYPVTGTFTIGLKMEVSVM